MQATHPLTSERRNELRRLLLGRNSDPSLPLPPIADLGSALHRLAEGARQKALLPVGVSPLEYALVRNGDAILVSAYETSSAPEVHLLNRPVDLRRLLCATAARAQEAAEAEPDKAARQVALHLAKRVKNTCITAALPAPPTRRVRSRSTKSIRPLSFGFDVTLASGAPSTRRSKRADVHAMLFIGELFATIHGRRVVLVRGPVLLAAQRMVVAIRALVEAWTMGRGTNVRLRCGSFGVGVRLNKDERASMTLRALSGDVKTGELSPDEIALPVLQLASSLIRALVQENPAQLKNLRVTALRDEVRSLRRIVRAQGAPRGFTSADADALRLASPPVQPVVQESIPSLEAPSGRMRFDAKWELDLDGLDASSTYFCGDRLVLSGPEHTLAVDRNSGDVLWARQGAASTLMARHILLRAEHDGTLEFCSVEDGEPFATGEINLGPTGQLRGFFVQSSGPASPPAVIVLTEGRSDLVAFDITTGQPRWRFSGRGGAQETLRRAGRVIVFCDGGAIHAIDAATGDDLWRFAVRGRMSSAPLVLGDKVLAITDDRRGRVFGIDLFSGKQAFTLSLGESPAKAPIAAGRNALFPLMNDRLVAVDHALGHVRWDISDPGLGMGAASLAVDDLLITNMPGGGVAATSLSTGSPRWTELLGDPIGDDVPRSLEPVLRGGALFVPAGDVHILRVSDGAPIGSVEADLVPDRFRVDERGWIYVAEESGHVAAYAPKPSLRLVRGGKS